MGIIILLSVPYKNSYATENSTFLIHQASSVAIGKSADLEDQTAETKRLTDLMYKIIVDNTDITDEDVEKNYKMKKDWILTSEEAKDLKLIYKVK
jgi:ATP-dependent protease ClpP protease subunit